MQLTQDEHLMLDGSYGWATRKSMEILTTLGSIYGAERMVPVTSVQVAGVSYDNLGEAGLQFLNELADGGGQGACADHAQPGGDGYGELAGAGDQPRVCRKPGTCARCFRPHERDHHLHLHALPVWQLCHTLESTSPGRRAARCAMPIRC